MHVDKFDAGKSTDYIHGAQGTLARITNNAVTYLHHDSLGSAQTGTASSGAILWQEAYTPYGETLNNVTANQDLAGFTGHIKDDATGLSYMQARYYDPVIGRFYSNDPVGSTGHLVSLQGVQGFNRYTYANNNPYKYTDPDGREIKVQWHEVAFGHSHTLIRIKPDNQNGLDKSIFSNFDSDGKRYATLGAGPEGFLGENLVSNINREADAAPHSGGLDVKVPSSFKNEDEFIDKLFELDGNYDDKADYDFFPSSSEEGNNSNSYVSGILKAVGATPPTPTVSTPGYDKPLDKKEFEKP